ncbi:MAG: integrase arm-type DNA-binding domain-containing protein [Rhizobiaceae bacterium]|nr:integrase arm-type DNA-binding domain-containing protein [Rhizobiaceae bacterium]
MARALHKLTDRECEKRRTKRGRLSDGGGLYLSFTASGAKSWAFVWQHGGRFREAGLGAYPGISLRRARELAHDMRKIVAEGGDPIATRREAAAKAVTFGEVADSFIDTMAPQFENEKHLAQWRMTLGDAYCKSLRPRPIGDVGTDDILTVLRPVWGKKPETASRIRGRIERVLDHARAKGLRDGENPARWRGHLAHILPPRKKLTRGHHAALPYVELPEFMETLREAPGVAARALELTILCATRTSETLNATWPEIDLERAVWTVPPERTKARREHRIPLSAPVVDLLRPLKIEARAHDWVFPGQKPGRPLSNMALAKVLARLGRSDVTVHGFRSSFRDWSAEETDHPREIAEAALAHVVGDATERAYRRGDALEKRRLLMSEWAEYLSKK